MNGQTSKNKLAAYWGFERVTAWVWFSNLVINFLPDLWIINRYVRPALARFMGLRCGPGAMLEKDVFYGDTRHITLGTKVHLCRKVFLDASRPITIGNHVSIAFQVTLITSSHEFGPAEQREGAPTGAPIVIEDGVWIAARAIVGPGAIVGAGSVISAGAALMHSIPPNSLVAGVPARVIKRLDAGTPAVPPPHAAAN